MYVCGCDVHGSLKSYTNLAACCSAYEILQLFRELLFGNVGVLLRLPFFGWLSVLMHCDDVSAYDFKLDLTDGGNGNVSMA